MELFTISKLFDKYLNVNSEYPINRLIQNYTQSRLEYRTGKCITSERIVSLADSAKCFNSSCKIKLECWPDLAKVSINSPLLQKINVSVYQNTDLDTRNATIKKQSNRHIIYTTKSNRKTDVYAYDNEELPTDMGRVWLN